MQAGDPDAYRPAIALRGDGLQLVGVVCDDAPQKDRAALATQVPARPRPELRPVRRTRPGTGPVRDRFQVQKYPTVVLLDGEGNVAWKGHPGNRDELESAILRQLGK